MFLVMLTDHEGLEDMEEEREAVVFGVDISFFGFGFSFGKKSMNNFFCAGLKS